jgi:hypothetical protein
MAKGKTTEHFEVSEIQQEEAIFNILGATPMIMNRFSFKARQELLIPKGKQSRATLESKMKHDPLAEFRGGLYLNRDKTSPTRFHVPNSAFHRAIAAAGSDMPGAAKAQLNRLASIVDLSIDLYGVPNLYMSMVRNSDMNRTPDVRTRPIFPEWACSVTVRWTLPNITRRTITNLFTGAGLIIGIGDWRPQKGGTHGRFKIVSDKDRDFARIVKEQGVKAQQAAYDKPAMHDEDTEELMAWFEQEMITRERTSESSKGKAKKIELNLEGELN